jgi:hypothetical protein
MRYTRLQQNPFRLLAAIITAGLLLPGSAYAGDETFQTVEVNLDWEDVPGNYGYVLQIQSLEGEPVKEIQIQVSAVTVQLSPGDYQVRLAALNKFRRPSIWTPWKEFNISGEEKTQSIQAEEKPETPGPLDYENFIPGMKRIQRGLSTGSMYDYAIGGGWIAGTVGSLLYFQSERAAGTSIARDSLNDPEFLGMALYGADFNAMLFASIRRGDERTAYRRHQSNQKMALGLFSILYVAQYVDAVLLGGTEQPVEGANLKGWHADLSLSPIPTHTGSISQSLESVAELRFIFGF